MSHNDQHHQHKKEQHEHEREEKKHELRERQQHPDRIKPTMNRTLLTIGGVLVITVVVIWILL